MRAEPATGADASGTTTVQRDGRSGARDEPPRDDAWRRASPGKPTGPITLDYALAGDVQPGVPVDVEITIGVAPGLTDIAVEARPSADLAVASPALARYAEPPEAGNGAER